jgi:hypothetical protein
MTIALTLILAAQVVTTDTVDGWASQYAPGVMARVIENRQRG